jgi:hypothetical protein
MLKRHLIAGLAALLASVPVTGSKAEGPPAPAYDISGDWELVYERWPYNVAGVPPNNLPAPPFAVLRCSYNVTLVKGGPLDYPVAPSNADQLKLGPITGTAYSFTGHYTPDDPAHPIKRDDISNPCYDSKQEQGAAANYGKDTVFRGEVWLMSVPRQAGVGRHGVMVMVERVPVSDVNAAGYVAAYEGFFNVAGAIGGLRTENHPGPMPVGSALNGGVPFTMVCKSGPCSKTVWSNL